MNPEQGNGRDTTSKSFFTSLQTSFQQGRMKLEQSFSEAEKMRVSLTESFEQAKQQGQTFFTDMMTQGKQKFEETRSLIPVLQKPPITSQQIDKGVQELGSMGVEATREWSLLKPDPNDGFIRKWQKKGINFGINKVAEYSQEIIGFTKDFSSGVADKVVPNFVDNYHPANVFTAITHPDLLKQQAEQHWDRWTTLYRAYKDPSIIQTEIVPSIKDSVANTHSLYTQLDGHGTESLSHGGRAVKDLVQDKVADVAGTGVGVFASFNATQTLRTQTKQMKDWLFPRGTVIGTAARFPLTQLLFTNPLSKLMAHPVLAGTIGVYGGLSSMGKNIRDMEELKMEAPDIASRTKLIDASSELTKVRSVSTTSHKVNGKTA